MLIIRLITDIIIIDRVIKALHIVQTQNYVRNFAVATCYASKYGGHVLRI